MRMHGHTDAVALMAGAQDHRIDGRQIKVSACWDADIEDVVQLCCDVVDFSIAMDLVVPAVQWASSLEEVGQTFEQSRRRTPVCASKGRIETIVCPSSG